MDEHSRPLRSDVFSRRKERTGEVEKHHARSPRRITPPRYGGRNRPYDASSREKPLYSRNYRMHGKRRHFGSSSSLKVSSSSSLDMRRHRDGGSDHTSSGRSNRVSAACRRSNIKKSSRNQVNGAYHVRKDRSDSSRFYSSRVKYSRDRDASPDRDVYYQREGSSRSPLFIAARNYGYGKPLQGCAYEGGVSPSYKVRRSLSPPLRRRSRDYSPYPRNSMRRVAPSWEYKDYRGLPSQYSNRLMDDYNRHFVRRPERCDNEHQRRSPLPRYSSGRLRYRRSSMVPNRPSTPPSAHSSKSGYASSFSVVEAYKPSLCRYVKGRVRVSSVRYIQHHRSGSSKSHGSMHRGVYAKNRSVSSDRYSSEAERRVRRRPQRSGLPLVRGERYLRLPRAPSNADSELERDRSVFKDAESKANVAVTKRRNGSVLKHKDTLTESQERRRRRFLTLLQKDSAPAPYGIRSGSRQADWGKDETASRTTPFSALGAPASADIVREASVADGSPHLGDVPKGVMNSNEGTLLLSKRGVLVGRTDEAVLECSVGTTTGRSVHLKAKDEVDSCCDRFVDLEPSTSSEKKWVATAPAVALRDTNELIKTNDQDWLSALSPPETTFKPSLGSPQIETAVTATSSSLDGTFTNVSVKGLFNRKASRAIIQFIQETESDLEANQKQAHSLEYQFFEDTCGVRVVVIDKLLGSTVLSKSIGLSHPVSTTTKNKEFEWNRDLLSVSPDPNFCAYRTTPQLLRYADPTIFWQHLQRRHEASFRWKASIREIFVQEFPLLMLLAENDRATRELDDLCAAVNPLLNDKK